ncbi:hypothetical protein H4Q26_005494 [Puccinia striiformis f. sp. tritici PST-130]|nr:hypothetical protein H4Q26_005494 [Puccinia striiformis f. sp. tritici PST-130]
MNNQFTNSLNRLNNHQQQQHRSSGISRRVSRRLVTALIITTVIVSCYYWPRLRNKQTWPTNISNESTPRLSRDVLEVLDQLDQSQMDDDQKAIHEMMRTSTTYKEEDGLPVVTSLPADHHHQQSNKPNNNCPASPCKFLIAGYLGEQETKAQIHIHQLGLLAISLNRTLVLPQVSQSRLGSCLEHPFDLYYQPDSLDQLGIKTITHHQFIQWATTQTELPTSRLISIVDHHQIPSTPTKGSISYDTTTPNNILSFKPDHQFCLKNTLKPSTDNHAPPSKKFINLNFENFKPLSIISPNKWAKNKNQRDKFAERIINSIRESDQETKSGRSFNPDVLMMNYELRYPFLDPESTKIQNLILARNEQDEPSKPNQLKRFEHFEYAKIWTELAESIVKQTPTMVGIHWRQENIKVDQLSKCASSLLIRLKSLKLSFPSLQVIYLSTDYPIEHVFSGISNLGGTSVKAHSGTFSKSITVEHHQIMKELFNHNLSSLKWFTFNSLIENLDLSPDLIDKFLQVPIFIKIKEVDRLMKVRNREILDHHQNQNQINQDQNYNKIQTLIKSKLTLKVEDSTEAEEEEKIDMGIIAIIEKLILSNGSLFMTGIPNHCSKLSSFTNQIIQSRLNLIDINFVKNTALLDDDYPGVDNPNLKKLIWSNIGNCFPA